MATKLKKKDESNKAHDRPADHSTSLKKLNRLIGQLEGVKRMIEEDRYCIDILTQTLAIGAALKGIEIDMVKRHLHHCMVSAVQSGSDKDIHKKVDELTWLMGKL